MRAPTAREQHDHPIEHPDIADRLGGLLRRRQPSTIVLLAVAVIGATAFVARVLIDDTRTLVGDRFQRIDQYVKQQANNSRIPGVSLAIVENGAVVHARGFGKDGHGNQVTADTPFWIGSNTKSITALAVMQLVEAGLVDLDTPVKEYLPEFTVADKDASSRITVRHLLNQTSGISRQDGLRAIADADPRDSIADVLAGMADLDLNRPVGERFEYANLNYVAVGALLEAVTGESWADYLQRNIFTPLAMTSSFTDQSTAEASGLTATYRYFFGFPMRSDAAHYPGLGPTGYVYASANDMARYLTMYLESGALDGTRVLSAAGIAEMLAPATDVRTFSLQSQEFSARYGAGWFIGPFGAANDARWHQGSLANFTTWMVLLPDTNQAVIVMLNAGNQFEIGGANATWSRLPQGVVNILRGVGPPTGTGTARFFVVFTTLVVMAVIAQAWALARVLQGRRRPKRLTLRHAAPLTWELVVAPLMLLGYPAVTGGLGWRAAFAFVPDLSLAVAVVGGLALLTGIARSFRLISTHTTLATLANRGRKP